MNRESPMLRQPLPVIPSIPQPLTLSTVAMPPRLPPRNTTPVLYNSQSAHNPIESQSAGHSTNSSSSSHTGHNPSPKVIDDLSEDLPVISGLDGGDTDTLPRSGEDALLSEAVDSDLDGMQLSDNEGDGGEPGGSGELAPLVSTPPSQHSTDTPVPQSEHSLLMQRNIPRSNDYPSDDENDT